MFSRAKSREETKLEIEIFRAIGVLETITPGSKEYAALLDQLSKLYELKGEKPTTVSKDTLAMVGANLLGILLVIKHESVNVITSRAFNLLMKPRV
jgi:hypothetical protein